MTKEDAEKIYAAMVARGNDDNWFTYQMEKVLNGFLTKEEREYIYNCPERYLDDKGELVLSAGR